ncbi:FAD-binding oxidoreductase [Streptomyces sp. NPDC047085]|uniref:FAD-binding oxidoreductase n=1 Tax=Streptomyces sp. NPDC047085 TaxID=3155140 RepID=UPI0033BFD79D
MQSDISVQGAVRELLTQLEPDQILTGGPGYREGARLWNGAVEHRPALIVRPRTPGQVRAAVLAARDNGLPLSVRGGGHDWAGRSLRSGGLVIDLAQMRHVAVDRRTRAATLQGGATAEYAIAAAASQGLSAVTGMVGGVGMAGLTLAGGYGPLNGRAGLALDNMLAADVVLADGRLVTADDAHHPELHWALRGAGGNFGVVTSLRIRLHAGSQLLAGLITYPLSQAAHVFERLDAFLPTAPDDLTVQSGLVTGPDGTPVVLLAPAWSGDPARGEAVVSPLQQLGSPLSAQVAPMPLAQMLRLNEELGPAGRHYALATRTIAGFTPGVVAALAEAAATSTSPLSGISVHHFHGAATRVPLEATAFGLRRAHFMVEIVAAWQPGDGQAAGHRAWADATSSALAPHALPGGYPNLLGPAAHDQIAHAYGPHTGRLTEIKERYDPEHVFAATPLPAAGNQVKRAPAHRCPKARGGQQSRRESRCRPVVDQL